MREKTKKDIIFGIKVLLILIAIFGILFISLYATVSPAIKKEQSTRYKEIQSYNYIIVDGIYFKTSEIKEFEDESGPNYQKYIFILKDETKIETDGYILTNTEEIPRSWH